MIYRPLPKISVLGMYCKTEHIDQNYLLSEIKKLQKVNKKRK